jgi:hypothetical protein
VNLYKKRLSSFSGFLCVANLLPNNSTPAKKQLTSTALPSIRPALAAQRRPGLIPRGLHLTTLSSFHYWLIHSGLQPNYQEQNLGRFCLRSNRSSTLPAFSNPTNERSIRTQVLRLELTSPPAAGPRYTVRDQGNSMAPVNPDEEQDQIAIPVDEETAHEISVCTCLQIYLSRPRRSMSLSIFCILRFMHFVLPS